MMPGVTHLPVPSITMRAGGRVDGRRRPRAILPSRSRIAPFRIAGPAAVRIVALRMSVGREGSGW